MSLRMEAGFEHLRQAMAEILARDVEFPGMFVTVLNAKMTANTAHAKFTLSVFPAGKEKEVKVILDEMLNVLKDELGQKLRLRRIPRLHFVFDTTEAHAAEIEQVINEEIEPIKERLRKKRKS